MNFRKARGAFAISTTFLSLCLFATSLAFDNSGQINVFLHITGEANTKNSDYSSVEEMRKAERENEIKTQEEGSVLLFDHGALPLATTSKVTLLGRTSADNIFRGASGGSATTEAEARNLHDALKDQGYSINETVYDALKASPLKRGRGNIAEVTKDFYDGTLTDSFSSYQDAAIITLGRYSGEQQDYVSGGETSQPIVTDSDGNPIDSEEVPMLSLHQEEKDVIQLAKDKGFKKIIVLLNTGAPMDVGELQSLGVDSCLWIGYPGYAGFDGVASLLAGKADPSGRLADTYATSSLSAPAVRNYGTFTFNGVSGEEKSHYLVYAEGIYVGYRYYETRYHDQVLSLHNATSNKGVYAGETSWNYADEMVYPFGYGLSYNQFKEEVQEITWDRENKKVKATVNVTNLGARDGVNYSGTSKDVVELYVSLPYQKGETEKSAIQLVGFTKTKELKKGESQKVTIEADDYLFATYDDKATNGADTSKTGCYVFDRGDYLFAVGDDAHDALNNALAYKGATGLTDPEGKSVKGDSKKVVSVNLATLDNTTYAKSPSTGEIVSNQFEEMDITHFLPGKVTYLTREDWNTYPDRITDITPTEEMLTLLDGHSYSKPSDAPEISSFKYSQKYDTPMLLSELVGVSYDDDEKWDKFIDQLTPSQLASLAGEKFGMTGIESLGIPSISSADGPDGIQANAGFSHVSENLATSTYNVELYQSRGKFMAEDGMASGQSGVYGLGGNMHRSVYGGRNFEYYSEEPVLAYLAGAEMTKACNDKGLTTYTKHFCANDQEANRNGYSTFMTESTFRNITLKAFEGSFTKGGSLGTMTSNARVGMTVASMSKALMTQVLRNEWGFKGVAMTDSSKGSSNYLYTKESIAAGIDQFNNDETRGSTDMKNYLVKEKDGYLWKRAREIAKHYYYMLTNNFVLAGNSSDQEVKVNTPWWQIAIPCVDGAVGLVSLVFLSFMIVALVQKKKKA
ncbi:MAG: glycoside hydrolase family 3 C-terminal domain-containing protein [Eubacteriales bacterium]|nr:glycoside hydrolase family 3 C-terminal domain-containing protein [Eubacteriales bacterium]